MFHLSILQFHQPRLAYFPCLTRAPASLSADDLTAIGLKSLQRRGFRSLVDYVSVVPN